MSSHDNTTRARGPIAWMTNNPVAANLVMIVLLVGGFLSVVTMKQEVFPDFELDIVNVSVSYPGASPEEVEQGIILAVEEAVRGLDGVDQVTSVAREGGGTVSVELLLGANSQKVYQDIQQEVDRITTFPEEAEQPNVTLVSRRREVINMAVYGDLPDYVLREMAERVRDTMLQDPDITQVELSGVRDFEISVEIQSEVLRAYGLTLDDVAQRISTAAMELPGGEIKTAGGQILIRIKDRRDYAREFARIPIISHADGTQVLLGDLAKVAEDFEDVDRYATYDGKPAVMVEVYRVGDQTPVQVADAALRRVEILQDEFPPGLKLAVVRDMSSIYRQRAHLLLKNGAIGLVLVLCLLSLFLEMRLAFWVMMGIPISFLGGLLLLPFFGLSINMISMFAFLIALGIVVDDAIVVGENVYEYHQRGMPFIKAAVAGAREVAMPVTFSVLTNVVTFLPLFFVPGFIGKIWKVIPAVVVTVFMISLAECLYILPAHLGHGGKRRTRPGEWLHKRQQRFSLWFSHLIRDRYGPLLDRILRYRYLTVAVGVAILLVTLGYVKSKRIGMIPMPRVESDYSVVTAVLPYGTAMENTERVRDVLEDACREVADENGGKQLVKGIFSDLGRSFRNVGGSHVVEVRAFMTDPKVRPISTRKFTELWRSRVGNMPGLKTIMFESDRGGPGSGASLTVELSHKDSEKLSKASLELAEALETYPIVKDIDDGYMPGKAQLDFQLRPEGQALGLTSAYVARQVRYAFYGAEALRQQRGRNEVKVKVRLPEEERQSEYDIESLQIKTPAGTYVPLSEVATVKRGRAYTSIDRRNGRRTLTVSANVVPHSATQQIQDNLVETYLPELQQRYPGLVYGFEGRQRDFSEGMDSLFLGFAIAVFVIYALLAIPFNSYIQPIIIMVSIPFGIVGAVIGHIIMGYSLSLMSMMGIVALAGVVVNDSLVFIDFANREKRRGLSTHDAVCSAGVRRFRPIMLTTLTTFGGLAPMIFETSRQARFMIPMAISLGFGILFATLITLGLVPSLYLVVEDITRLNRRVTRFFFGDRDPAGEEA